MTLERVQKLLSAACDEAGSAKAWAESHEIAASYVSDVINGRCEPGEKILNALGLRRSVEYERGVA